MSLTIPKGRTTAGTRRALFIEGGVKDKDAITKAEVTAAENVSCYLAKDGFNAGIEQTTIPDERDCSAQSFEIPGPETATLEISYVTNLDEPDDDAARLAMKKGVRGTIVRFYQKDTDDGSFDVGDWYTAVDVECGKQIIVEGDGNGVDKIKQKMFVQSVWTDLCQVVATTP